MFEQALHRWQVELPLSIALVLSTSEMVKAVVEQGVGAAALPEIMIQKELKLETLWAVQVVNANRDQLDIVQPILKLKHQKRFQTQIIEVFEHLLTE
jgi:DNA-binding transcriptional LysR family regulator